MKQEPQVTNRYQIINKLGQGGMGTVYKAYDRLEKQYIALKQVLIPEKQLDFASKAGTDDTDKLRLSLTREFSILATLRHPHILSVLDYGFDDQGSPFYTMILLEGGQDFNTYAKGQTDVKKYELLTQMLQALHYLHRRGVLHRDLKPDNVFVTADGQVKVMDFGLAKQEKIGSAESEEVAGTISYMAPELFQGGTASVASDLFAIGVMAYEIMVGKHPFESQTIGERILKIMMHTPDSTAISTHIAPWLETLLEKDPAKRHPTAYDALRDFYNAAKIEAPAENDAIRESFLQASTFVGREVELKQLADELDEIETENAFFLIGGESGVGKSRLLDELRIQALVKGATVLRGQSVEGGGLPFQLWRNIARRLLLMVDVTDLQAGILKDLVPDVSELLGRDIPDVPELTGRAYQDRIVLAIVDLLRNTKQSIVLLLEDLQWAEQSLAPLKQILLVKDQLPTLIIVANYRDEEAPKLPDELAGMTPIKLERLDTTAVRNLCASMLGESGIHDELVQTIQRNSEGNTFFITETVRALAEEHGSLEKVTTADLPQVVFTGSMQELMQRRLRQVDDQYAGIQTLAAVIGREIDTQILAHAYEEATVQGWLNNASDYGVVAIQDNTWRFAHDKLRETLIADIPDDETPNIHRTAAETIEAIYPDDARYNEALLRHWHGADDLDKELHYLDPVAEHMITVQGAYQDVIDRLKTALKRLNEQDPRRVAILNHLAIAHQPLGQIDQTTSYAEQAHQLAVSLGDDRGAATSLNHLGAVAVQRGDNAKGTDLFQQSMAIGQRLDDLGGIAFSLNNLGIIAYNQGEYDRATDLYQQSLEIRQKRGDQRAVALILANLGVIAAAQNDKDLAINRYEKTLTIFRSIGDQRGIAGVLYNLGNVVAGQEEKDLAINYYQQSLTIFRQLGDTRLTAFVLSSLGSSVYKQGDKDRAIDLLQQSLNIRQRINDQRGIVDCLIKLGRVALDEGDTHVAEERFGQGLRVAHQIAAVPLMLWAIIMLSAVLLQREQGQRAARLAGLTTDHPAQDANVRAALDELMPQLKAALTQDELQNALEQGKSLDLDSVVAELLTEFGNGVSIEGQAD